MKKFLLVFFSIFLSANLFAQYRVTIEAFVLDKNTNQPIPYVNIGFVEKSIGTVSNEEGKFTLIYHDNTIGGKELLQFSALGYKTLKVRASKLAHFLTNTDKIFLEPSPEILDEIIITDETRRHSRVGILSKNDTFMGYWKDKIALGGEIAAKIKIKKRKTKLLDIKFNIVENLSDSLKIRVNVYKYERRFPRTNISKTNIFHTITKKKGIETIDLKKYNIIVDNDIVVGLELVEVYGDSIGFAVSASKYSGTSFIRYISQDKWMRYAQIGMNFNLLVSYPTDSKKDISIARELPKKITLYWDTSLSLKNRKLIKEFELLTRYLKKLKTAKVEVIKFNNRVSKAQIFQIEKGKSKALLEYLKNTSYDGTSDYKDILKGNNFNAEIILLFTDGKTVFSQLEPEIYVPVFAINSLYDANDLQLQKTAFYADGHYINLNTTSVQLGLNYMLKEVEDKVVYANNSNRLYKGDVKGKVFSVSEAIHGATIRVQNTFIEAQSDINGFFDIDAKQGDTLVVNFLGMQEKKVEVPRSKNIYILMKPDGELLKEVILTGGSKKNESIETGYGKRNKDAIGFSVRTITSKDIKPHYNTLADVIRGQFAGIQVVGLDPNFPKFIIRGSGSFNNVAYAVFDIDGMIYTENPPYIDPQNIETITILKSLAATNRYGTLGGGGVIKIMTKLITGSKEKTNVDTALVKGNDYIENNVQLIGSLDKTPSYLRQLDSATTYNNALAVYSKHKKQRNVWSVPYYFDVSNYFMKWDRDFAFTILSNIASVAFNNPKALKALAYKFEELGKYNYAKSIYERIAVLRPNDEQSYRDLALIYKTTGDYKNAMLLYKQMLTNTIKGVDIKGLLKPIESELKQLLALHRSKVNYNDLPADFLKANFKYDLRIVFDWNDPSTEFEIQFVNPQRKYYTWSHTQFENKDRLLDEINYGYNTEEYIIDNANSGEWIINIKSFSKEDLLNPTFLKYTVFKNYGLANETKEVKVIKLYQQKQKVTLDKFFYK